MVSLKIVLFIPLQIQFVNIVRSVPFIILMVFILPLTKMIVGTRVGTTAAIVPLVIFIAPYLARLFENSILEVNKGIIEAAQSMGASHFEVILAFSFFTRGKGFTYLIYYDRYYWSNRCYCYGWCYWCRWCR